LVPSKGR